MIFAIWRVAFLLFVFSFSRVWALPFADTLPNSYFRSTTYSDFQISDGWGGDAERLAASVFVYPFVNVDLSTVPYEVYDDLQIMREATEDADVEAFTPKLAQAGPHTRSGQSLAVGQVKNKVLYYTAAVQALRVKIAKDQASGLPIDDTEETLDILKDRLADFISQDKQNSGFPSQSVQWPLVNKPAIYPAFIQH